MRKTAKQVFPTIILLSLALCALGRAQEAGAASQRVIVHAGKLLDVRTGKALTDQAIVIEEGKIVRVGPMGQTNRSSGDRLIDLPNATVLPGLTDAHTHLTGNPQDVGPQALSISIPRATLSGARNARLTLEAGFTTVRNVGAEGYERRGPAGCH
jgi:imidazolonepropionase-like amidohydrolase